MHLFINIIYKMNLQSLCVCLIILYNVFDVF